MDINLLTSLNDNIRIDRNKCTACGRCVEVCVLDNLRLSSRLPPGLPRGDELPRIHASPGPRENGQRTGKIREAVPFGGILGRICSGPARRSATGSKWTNSRWPSGT